MTKQDVRDFTFGFLLAFSVSMAVYVLLVRGQ